jgi:phage-related protein
MHAVYYRDAAGAEPVHAYIRALPVAARATVNLQIERLNDPRDDAPPLPFPHSSQIEGQLRELRCHHGKALYRVLYRRSHNLLVLLHIFEKRSAKVPESEIETARRRWMDFEARMNPIPQPPRAAGRDAP